MHVFSLICQELQLQNSNILFPLLDIVIFPESEPLSSVDCLATKLPMKPPPVTTTTPRPM
jgi:hypothetical protein